jgi:maltooligosyltrehalose trehalohydrolase
MSRRPPTASVARLTRVASPRAVTSYEGLGATVQGRTCELLVWAPRARTVEVALADRRVPLVAAEHGYFTCTIDDVAPGDHYRFVLDGTAALADPASRAQPQGVHGPSAMVDLAYPWTDDGWQAPPLASWVIYELHVGTFTPEGTFAGVIAALPRLRALGVDAIELMPVAEFPGRRNWGYDGVQPFAVHGAYGGACGLQALVDACHRAGLAVILDVVYNHLGPEGNYLDRFGPYFTDRYRTPWGAAVNFDGPGSDEVRRYFIANALMWLRDFHVDALRLDAVHAIVDTSPQPFLGELAHAVHALELADGRPRYLIAESDANDPRLVRPPERGGMGLHGVWADDFHHAVHVLLTGERDGYYRDYTDRWLLAEAITEGFAYRGQRSRFRQRRHGATTTDVSPSAFVVCVQNHDQVGNRVDGSRLSTLAPAAAQRLAAALLLTSAHVPLLFMGQEYGELRPFAYFTSHGDAALVEAVRRGRREEFAALGWEHEPPEPQDPGTFAACILRPQVVSEAPHRGLWALHQRLIRFRREHADAIVGVRPRCELLDEDRVLVVHLGEPSQLALLANLDPRPRTLPLPLRGRWTVAIDGEDPAFDGHGLVLAPHAPVGPTLAMPGWWFGLVQEVP